MKRDVAKVVSQCLTCQHVKVEHQKPGGLLQPLPILKCKWEQISMDFVTGILRTVKQHVWVIVDRLTKSPHFLAVKITYISEKLAELYIQEIVRLHGAPLSIVSNRDSKFMSKFWRGF